MNDLLKIADTIERNGGWTIAAIKVRAAHEELERLRAALREMLAEAWIDTHLEQAEFEDQEYIRKARAALKEPAP